MELMTHSEERQAARFDRVDQRFDLIERRFELVDRRFDQIDRAMAEGFGEVKEIRNEMWRLYRALVISAFAIVACLIGVILTNAG